MKKASVIYTWALLSATGVVGTVSYKLGVQNAPKSNTVLVTNLKQQGVDYEIPLTEQVPPRKIFNVSITAFSPHYADLFGFKDRSRVMEMPKGLEGIELRIQTLGKITSCYYRFYIDSNIDVDLPKSRIYMGNIPLQDLRQTYNSIFSEDIEHPMHKAYADNFPIKEDIGNFNRNVYIASVDYDYKNRKKPQMMRNPGLAFYIREYWPNISLLHSDLEYQCDGNLHRLKNTALWLKKSGKQNYSYRVNIDAEDFIILVFPEKFQEEAYSVLKEIPSR